MVLKWIRVILVTITITFFLQFNWVVKKIESTAITRPNKLLEDKILKPASYTVPNGTRYCLVHVGKAAGTKIRQVIEAMRRHKKGSRLSDAFIAELHIGANISNKTEKYNTFLFTLRNPLDRIVSWFYYERERLIQSLKSQRGRNKKCRKRFHNIAENNSGCFHDVDEFANSIFAPHNQETEILTGSGCQKLAFEVAGGQIRCEAHNHFNYEFYTRITKVLGESSADYPILAIRREYLAQDWNKLEIAFGTQHNTNTKERFLIFNETSRNARTSSNGNAETLLSDTGRQNLCTVLCMEIQVYKYLLLKAQNLDTSETRQSISEVIKLCPKETFEIRACPTTKSIYWRSLTKMKFKSVFDIRDHIVN